MQAIDTGKLNLWLANQTRKARQSEAKARLAKASNISRALSQRKPKHKPKTILGSGSIDMAWQTAATPRISATYQGRRQATHSRIPGAWSDMMREKPKQITYSPEYLAGLSWVKSLHNPNAVLANTSSVRYREWSDRQQSIITKTRHVDHGGTYQRTPAKLVMRGDPCLFDDCTTIEARISDMRPRNLLVGDVVTNRPKQARIKYHDMSASLPAWKATPIVKASKAELDHDVALWRMSLEAEAVQLLGM